MMMLRLMNGNEIRVFALGLVISFVMSLFKRKIFCTIPIIITAIIYIVTLRDNYFSLLRSQLSITIITVVSTSIIRAISEKKKNSKVDKSKIKDLM